MSSNEYPPLQARGSAISTPSNARSIPHPLDAEWDVSIDDQVFGPFTGHDLQAMITEGRVEYDTLVRRSGLDQDNWVRAANERSLARFFMPEAKSRQTQPHSISAGGGAQVVTVHNTIAAPAAYLGEKPVDKSPFLAAILSLLIVGVGQMYNGEFGKGILMMVGCILLWVAMLGWIINIWAVIDAYVVANRKHDAYDRWMQASAAAARAPAYA